MKNTILSAVVAGAIAGGGAAIMAVNLFPSDSAPKGSPAGMALLPGEASDTAPLIEEIAALHRENDGLVLRLVALESRPAGSNREAIAGADEASADYALLKEQIANMATALSNPQSSQSAGLRNAVASALDDVRAAEDAERQAEREARDIERVEERMDRYAVDLGLDAVQKKSMRDVLINETTQRNEMFTLMREGGGDRNQMRETFTTMRDETTAALSNILTSTQLEQYQESSSDRWGGMGRGSRGSTDGGGGRGGRGN